MTRNEVEKANRAIRSLRHELTRFPGKESSFQELCEFVQDGIVPEEVLVDLMCEAIANYILSRRAELEQFLRQLGVDATEQ